MTRPDRTDASVYARALEHEWSTLAGRPIVLSRKDWGWIDRWHARGVPLDVMRQAMLAAAARRPGAEPFRSLNALAPAIEEAWRVVLDGRLDGATRQVPAASDPSGGWRRAVHDLPDDSELAAVLLELLTRLDEGVAPGTLDDELDHRLPQLVSPPLLERLQRETDHALTPYRARMSAEQYARTRRRSLHERLRRSLQLSRLAGEPPPG